MIFNKAADHRIPQSYLDNISSRKIFINEKYYTACSDRDVDV